MTRRSHGYRFAKARPRVHVLAAAAAIVLAVAVTPLASVALQGQTISAVPASTTLSMRRTFLVLAAARTDACRDLGNKLAIARYIDALPNTSMLQGSCCNLMNFTRYVSQVSGLRQYSHISQVPADPYDVPARRAKQMLTFYNTIKLSPEQHNVYDEAALKTADKGWCCCQCWAWYTHAGLAKYLISHDRFTASQVTSVTNLEDCCGGA